MWWEAGGRTIGVSTFCHYIDTVKPNSSQKWLALLLSVRCFFQSNGLLYVYTGFLNVFKKLGEMEVTQPSGSLRVLIDFEVIFLLDWLPYQSEKTYSGITYIEKEIQRGRWRRKGEREEGEKDERIILYEIQTFKTLKGEGEFQWYSGERAWLRQNRKRVRTPVALLCSLLDLFTLGRYETLFPWLWVK